MITVDPGVNGSGIASWNSEGKLECVSYTTPRLGDGFFTDHLIVEVPQIYAGHKARGNPNDLVAVAFEAGRIAGLANTYEKVSPRQWKGTIKKEVMLRRILSKLADEELAIIKGLGLPPSKEHNVIDSVGIGLWKLGRL